MQRLNIELARDNSGLELVDIAGDVDTARLVVDIEAVAVDIDQLVDIVAAVDTVQLVVDIEAVADTDHSVDIAAAHSLELGFDTAAQLLHRRPGLNPRRYSNNCRSVPERKAAPVP